MAPVAGLERTLSKTIAASLAVSRAEGADIFDQLVLRLAEILEVDAVMIGRFDAAVPARVTTLATCLDGRLLKSFDYDLDGTPCRAMTERESRFMGSGVHDEFAPGTLFHGQGFDSYAAHTLVDGSGRKIGLIAAVHRRAMSDRALTEALLQIFAVRAGAELERRRVNAAARASEQSYRAIFDAAEDAIFVHDVASGRILDVNPQACRIFGYTHDELLAVRIADVSSNVPPYTEREAAEWLARARSGEPVRFEWHRRSKDGSLHWDEVVLKRAMIGGHERILAVTREITERKAADEALRLREEQYRAIFEGSADALVLWSRDIRIVEVNAAFCAMYGYSRDEIMGSTFGDKLPTLEVARRIQMIQRAIDGETGQLEARAVRKNGEVFDAEIRYLPILHRGQPHVLAIARDITERLRSDERLKASEARYRLLFEMESAAILLVDAQTLQLVDANVAAVQMYGYTRDELLRMTADALSDEPDETQRTIRVEEGALSIPLRWHRRRNGSRFPVEITANRLELAGRRIVVASVRDIGGRRAREEALKTSEARLRATLEAAFDCVIGLDQHGFITEFNAAAERCFGHARSAVLGKPLAETIIPERHRGAHAHGVAQVLARTNGAYEGRRFETTALRADGTEFPIELAITATPAAEGRIFVGYLRDLTELKRAEKERGELESQLRQAQKMEAIGHLTGGIAHDFNNILTSVMGYLTLATERPAAEADLKLQSHLEQAQQSCLRARDLIQQMLTFSRVRRGDPRPVALRQLLAESSRMLRATLPATLDLVSTIEGDPIALVDPVQAHQILLNLCINARDAMNEVGRIRVTAREVELAAAWCASCRHSFGGRFVELAVSDSGSGIPAEIRDRMFEPFFTTKEIGHGTGMGLSIVHGVVHDHGGHVLFESSRDKGTTFRIVLPLASLPPPAANASGTTRARHTPLAGRILLVEDEQSVLGFMRELLEGWGATVVAARDPADALKWFALEPDRFDLVLTDHTMPGMTGLELARALIAHRPALPVLMYSGRSELLNPALAQAAGIRQLLPKPVDPSALHAALRTQLDAIGARTA